MMRMSIAKQIGRERYTFVFEGQTLFDVVMASQQLGFDGVKECGLCGSDRLHLVAYETKEEKFQYVKVACGKCRGQVTFGKTKKDGTFYLRRDDGGRVLWEAAREERAA